MLSAKFSSPHLSRLYLLGAIVWAIDFSTKTKVIGECERCTAATKTFFNCATASCHELILLCEDCSRLDSNLSCVHSGTNKHDAEMVG